MFGSNRFWLFFSGFAFLLVFGSVLAANSCGDTNNVCTYDSPVSVSQTWIDGNTYVLLNDVNVTGSGVVLTVEPGVVVKYSTNTELTVMNSGRIVANGTADKNIVFTSCKDQNTYAGSTNADTSTISGCSGGPASGDYNTAIFVRSDSAMTTSDSFSYLRVYYPTVGIRIDTDIASIHDSNFALMSTTGGIVIRLVMASAVSIYNNTFDRITNIPAINSANAFTGRIYGNRFWTFLSSAGRGVKVPLGSGSRIYANDFNDFSSSAAGIDLESSSLNSAQIFDNNFSNFRAGYGIIADVNFNGDAHGNRFDLFSTSSEGFRIVNTTFSGKYYNNRLSNFMSSDAIVVRNASAGVSQFTGLAFNNLAKDFTSSGTAPSFLASTGTAGTVKLAGKIFNNTFSNFAATDIVRVAYAATQSTTVSRNLMANFDMAGLCAGLSASYNYNAYYNFPDGCITDSTVVYYSGNGFTSDPFLADGSDRNFLLNSVSTGGTQLVNAGDVDSNSLDVNNFFNLRTTQPNNKLDRGLMDIGYHYDQNSPYVAVVSPSDSNILVGTQSIDFNVESGFGSTSGLTGRLGYSSTASGDGTQIVSQSLAGFSCSSGPYFVCSYPWNTAAVPDANYFVVLTATDSNGSITDYSDSNFFVSNAAGASEGSGNPVACGNNVCQASETAANCPADCPAICGDFSCTHTENESSCPLDCRPGCGNAVCETGESVLACPVDCSGTDGETVLSEVVLDMTHVSPNRLDGIEDLLSSAGISDFSGVLNALHSVVVERSFVVQIVSSPKGLSRRTKVVLTVTNLTDHPLKDIRLIERVPERFLESSGNLDSPFPLKRILQSNLFEITVSGLLANQSLTLEYYLPLELGRIDLDFFSVPLAVSASLASLEDVQNLRCTDNAQCEEGNKCTVNRCISGTCYSLPLAEGEVCDVASVCKENRCISEIQLYSNAGEFDLPLLATVFLIAVAFLAIGYEYLKK